MQPTMLSRRSITFSLALLLLCALPSSASAHCDTMNGPVVLAARHALETGNVNLVLIWVKKDDETVIRDAFQRTMKVRSLNPEAKALADLYFFETLVRIHRAGEGVAYTGLKSAETEVDPGIAAADHAVEEGTSDDLQKHLQEAVHKGMTELFGKLKSAQKYEPNDLARGRAYVQAYVTFIHYVEGMFQSAGRTAPGHMHESGLSQEHFDQH